MLPKVPVSSANAKHFRHLGCTNSACGSYFERYRSETERGRPL